MIDLKGAKSQTQSAIKGLGIVMYCISLHLNTQELRLSHVFTHFGATSRQIVDIQWAQHGLRPVGNGHPPPPAGWHRIAVLPYDKFQKLKP